MNHSFGILAGTHVLTKNGPSRQTSEAQLFPCIYQNASIGLVEAARARVDWFWADGIYRLKLSTGDELAFADGQLLLSEGRRLGFEELKGVKLDTFNYKDVYVEGVTHQRVTARVFRYRFMTPGYLVCRSVLVPTN